jgi:hypothetical protein
MMDIVKNTSQVYYNMSSSELFKVELKLVKHSEWKTVLTFTVRSHINNYHTLFIVFILVSTLNEDTNIMKHVPLIISCFLLRNTFYCTF